MSSPAYILYRRVTKQNRQTAFGAKSASGCYRSRAAGRAEPCMRGRRNRDIQEEMKGHTRAFHSASITQVKGSQWKGRM